MTVRGVALMSSDDDGDEAGADCSDDGSQSESCTEGELVFPEGIKGGCNWPYFFERYKYPRYRVSASNKKDTAHRTSFCFALVKWSIPAFIAGTNIFIGMWLMHIGTYYYIRVMDRFEESYLLTHVPKNDSLSAGLNITDTSFGSLEDPLEGELGWVKIPMERLDAISAFLPLTWALGTVAFADLQLWTKMLFINAFMALGKGVFSVVTIVPDSIGWQECKKRLQPENLSFLREKVPPPEKAGFLGTAWALFKMEVAGTDGNLLNGREGVRWCADMLYSGHTYFTCLYALGLVELVWCKTSHLQPHWHRIAMTVVCLVTVCEQILEISMVIANRFHYTMDVMMAILLTFLFFTNSSIIVSAKAWVRWEGHLTTAKQKRVLVKSKAKILESIQEVKGMDEWLGKHKHVQIVTAELHRDEGDIWVPPCCFPFCLQYGRHHVFYEDHRISHADTEQHKMHHHLELGESRSA